MLSVYQQTVQTVAHLITLGALAAGICFGYATADLIERLWKRQP